MSDFGVMLLFGAGLVLMLGLIRGLAWLTDVLESGGFRAMLRRNFDHYAERRVNTFAPAPAPQFAHSVKLEAQTGASATRQTADARVSAADPYIERLRLDRTRITLIELMVYTGWSVGEIRGVLKGDNTVISSEIEQARQKLGIAEAPRAIPLAERGAPPRPLVLDPELPYQPPPR